MDAIPAPVAQPAVCSSHPSVNTPRLVLREPEVADRPNVEAHLDLVMSEARRLARRLPSHIGAEDLIGNGCLGLLNAVRLYKPSHGTTFQTFARLKIRGAMLDGLRDLDQLSRWARHTVNQVKQARQRYVAEHGCEPDAMELAAAVGISPETLDEIYALDERTQIPESLEAAEATLSMRFHVSPVETSETAGRLAQAVRQLPQRHQAVLSAYYQADMTFKQIGQQLGVSESRVCQIHSEAVKALRKLM